MKKPKSKKKSPELLRCQVRKTLRFGSGKVALEEGADVWMEIGYSGQTFWIWNDSQEKKLLFTFNNEKEAIKYIAVVR